MKKARIILGILCVISAVGCGYYVQKSRENIDTEGPKLEAASVHFFWIMHMTCLTVLICTVLFHKHETVLQALFLPVALLFFSAKIDLTGQVFLALNSICRGN